ncbi:MAG TPA: thioredoxin domain-containing protein, partial [bacterium]|nr:thioredoxin domain-containing protein [bacterium]
MTAPAARNRLAGETSPYLLQHAGNPVDWYPWGDEALERARAEDKPILVSIGYSACHWCHVMEHESFEDPQIAALMNEHFVCIKVDREERPDVDEVYMTAVQLMGIPGGWPLNVFLTPDGRPFFGGTYFPPEDRYGRAGWPRVLAQVARAWETQRESVLEQAGGVVEALGRSSEFAVQDDLPGAPYLDSVREQLAGSFDDTWGGFGGAPKFPPSLALEFLLRRHARHGDEEDLRMVVKTLDAMARGGMYDQLGGGFHRYSVDEKWLVPHFEKMLYDNAMLARVYVQAWQVTGEDRWARVARETLDWTLREMTEEGGGFRSSTDADSDGREG